MMKHFKYRVTFLAVVAGMYGCGDSNHGAGPPAQLGDAQTAPAAQVQQMPAQQVQHTDSGTSPLVAGAIGYILGSSFGGSRPAPAPQVVERTVVREVPVYKTAPVYKAPAVVAPKPVVPAAPAAQSTYSYKPVTTQRSYSYTPSRSSFSSSSFRSGRR